MPRCACKYEAVNILSNTSPLLHLSIFTPKHLLISLTTSKLIYKRVICIVKNGSLIAGFLSPLAEEDASRGPRGATALSAALPGNDLSSSFRAQCALVAHAEHGLRSSKQSSVFHMRVPHGGTCWSWNIHLHEIQQ